MLGTTPTTGVTAHPAVAQPGWIRIVDPSQLLGRHRAALQQINELAGVSLTTFNTFYLDAIQQFARLAQQLPATECHHHPESGGLLAHTLEVCVLALRLRRPYLFSAQEGAEAIAQKQDLWTYAVFLGALCHDLPKLLSGRRIEVFSRQGRGVLPWNAFGGFMDQQGDYYRYHFVRSGQPLHAKLAPLLVPTIVPQAGMQWLSHDPLIMTQWLAAIAGDFTQAAGIGEIVSLGDQQSVRQYLGAGNPIPDLANPNALQGCTIGYKKILTALRYLLDSGGLPLNGPDGAAWVKGDDCWLGSKISGDRVRAQLAREGHRDAPTLNSQVFDILQDHRVIIQNGDNATWDVVVSGNGGWRRDLTALRIPSALLWPNPASRPDDFAGNLQLSVGTSDAGLVQEQQSAFASVAELGLTPTNAHLAKSSNDFSQMDRQDIGDGGMDDETGCGAENAAGDNPVLTAAVDSVQTMPVDLAGPAITRQRPPPPSTLSLNRFTENTPGKTTHPKRMPGDGPPGDIADAFMAWLRSAVKQRAIPINEANAPVHRVAEGVLLATPDIFKAYAKMLGSQEWTITQKAVQKKYWHARNAEGLNIFNYSVTGDHKQSAVNGFLFLDPSLIFGDTKPPEPNPHFTQKR